MAFKAVFIAHAGVITCLIPFCLIQCRYGLVILDLLKMILQKIVFPLKRVNFKIN